MLNKKFIATLATAATLLSGVALVSVPSTAYASEISEAAVTNNSQAFITFTHPALKSQVLESMRASGVINKSVNDVAPDQAASVTHLNIASLADGSTPITSILDFSYFTHLKDLFLDCSHIANLSQLSGLNQVQKLSLVVTSGTNLSQLSGLNQVQTLNLIITSLADSSQSSDPSVINLSGLSVLPNLQNLDIDAQVTDLQPLVGLKNLQNLNIAVSADADITPLAALKHLHTLNLYGPHLENLSGLSGATSLKRLILNSDIEQAVDASPLANLTNLVDLSIGMSLADVAPLASLSHLQRLQLSGSKISDISSLAALQHLQTLKIIGTNVTDVSALSSLSSLKKLFISSSVHNDTLTALKQKLPSLLVSSDYSTEDDDSPIVSDDTSDTSDTSDSGDVAVDDFNLDNLDLDTFDLDDVNVSDFDESDFDISDSDDIDFDANLDTIADTDFDVDTDFDADFNTDLDIDTDVHDAAHTAHTSTINSVQKADATN